MSIEDRLFALVNQARLQHGDAFLANPGQLVPLLSSQAPDLHAEIRALGAALASNAGAGLASAADPAAEAERLAGDLAAREKLSMGSARSAVEVARRVGSLSGGAAPAAGDDAWAGDSVVVGGGAPTPPPYQPPHQPAPGGHVPPPPPTGEEKPPIWKNKWVLGGAGLVALLIAFQAMQPKQPGPNDPNQGPPNQGPNQGPNTGPNQGPNTGPNQGPNMGPNTGPNTGPNQGPPPVSPPPPGGGGGGQAPLLQPPSGNLPTLQVQRDQQGNFGVGFLLQIQSGVAQGLVMLPANGWDAGPGFVGFLRPGAGQQQQPDSVGGGQFQRINGQYGTMRVMRPQWQQDRVGFGNVCIAFISGQQGSQDVPLQGSTMCVMDASCSQASACGRLQ